MYNLYLYISNSVCYTHTYLLYRKFQKCHCLPCLQHNSVQMYYSKDGTKWTSAESNFLTSWTADLTDNGFLIAPGSFKSVTNKTLTAKFDAGDYLYLAFNISTSPGGDKDTSPEGEGTNTDHAQALGIDNFKIGGGPAASPLPGVHYRTVQNGDWASAVLSPTKIQEGQK